MNNKNPPLSIFKATSKNVIPAKARFRVATTGIQKFLIYFVFLPILALLIPFISNAQLISPRISLTSSPDPSGVLIDIKGTGFSPGSTATLYSKNPDGSETGILATGVSTDGSFNINQLFSTGYPSGTYLFWVVDGPTGRFSNRVNFRMPSTQPIETRIPPPPPPPPTLPSYAPQHGDLIKAKGDTKVYLVQGQQHQGQPLGFQRRAIANEQVFNQMGFKWSDVKEIDRQDVMILPEGKPIWSREFFTPFPEGALVRLKGQTQTYVIREGKKCYIPDSETFQTMGTWDQVIEVDKATLDSIFTGIPIPSVKPPFQYTPPGQPPPISPPIPTGPSPPVQPQPSYPPPSSWPQPGSTPYPTQPQSSFPFFPDGTLIKGSGPDIYLIENGVRRLIPDMETFNAMGLNWGNIINVDQQRLVDIPLGVPPPSIKKRF